VGWPGLVRLMLARFFVLIYAYRRAFRAYWVRPARLGPQRVKLVHRNEPVGLEGCPSFLTVLIGSRLVCTGLLLPNICFLSMTSI
jgi:hypothetical protein